MRILATVLGTLLLIVVVGALVWSGAINVPALGLDAAPAAEIHTIGYPLAGADSAEVRLAPGVAELNIDVAPGSRTLIEGEIRTGRGERLIESASMRGDSAVVELRSETLRRFGFGMFGRDQRWDLTLSDRAPLELFVDSGVGRSNLDLRGLELSGIRVDSGVGEIVVTLPDTGGYSGSFDSGVGATHIRIPAGVAASIEVDTGVGRAEVTGDFVRSGDRYQTPGFDSAGERIELSVDGGVGAITIEQIR